MRSILLLVVALIAVASSSANAAPPRPNIVLILVDDLGWGDLSCYGQANWQTPRIDQMAAEGMRFTDAYAGSTVCAPSRAALLTGLHTGRGYLRGNGPIALRRDPLDTTIATRLKQLGYTTAMIGKSGVACRSTDADLPNDKGFDHFFGVLDHAEAHRNYPTRLVRNGVWLDLPANNGKTGETYANTLFVDDAIAWLADRGDTPFFLNLSLTPPHADLSVPDEYAEPFRGRWPEQPHTSSGYLHQTEPKANFAGMIAFIDEAVGKVLDTLDEQGLAGDTLVIFTSDNGPHAEGGANPAYFDSNGPFRGKKRDLYEGGIRVPFIARWPGTIEPGVVTDQATAFWDFPPTALELAGGEALRDFNGVSIVPTLAGVAEAQQSHPYLYWEFYEQGGKQAVRWGDWKGVRLNVHDNPQGPIELYNLAVDPGETQNVAADHDDVLRRIARFMDHAHDPSPEYHFGKPERSISRQPGERRVSNERDRRVLDRSGFSIESVSSESAFNGRVARAMLDDDPATHWHTEWREARPTHPHTVTIDLGTPYDVAGIRIMSRQDPTDHGVIDRVEIRVADDPAVNAPPTRVARLRFTKDEQEVLFKEPARGRYLTITTRSAHSDSPFATIANLEVLGTR